MWMELEPIILGRRCRVYGLQTSGGCLAKEFLATQEQTMPEEVAKMMRLLDYTAQHGPPKNDEKCNTLCHEIFEFKTTKLRLAWFWDAGYVIVCSHGWLKKSQKSPRAEIDRAVTARAAYFKAKQEKKVRTLDPK